MVINWTGSNNDYTAHVDGYTLRAEMLDRGLWWCCCYCPDGSQTDVYTNDKYGKNGKEAKAEAVRAMEEHNSRINGKG